MISPERAGIAFQRTICPSCSQLSVSQTRPNTKRWVATVAYYCLRPRGKVRNPKETACLEIPQMTFRASNTNPHAHVVIPVSSWHERHAAETWILAYFSYYNTLICLTISLRLRYTNTTMHASRVFSKRNKHNSPDSSHSEVKDFTA
jgi:hypothetical protein